MIYRIICNLTLVCNLALASESKAVDLNATQKLLGLPERPKMAPGGSEFIQKISKLPTKLRDKMIVDEIISGNIPEFQRHLVPVERKIVSGPYRGKTLRYWVLPDYLAIGSEQDYVRVPLNMPNIMVLAQQLNLSLPTTLMVDDIYAQAQLKLKPTTLPSGREMSGVQYFSYHNSLVQHQLQQSEWKPGMLVAGHKKDVVQSLKLIAKPQAVAIYGWHNGSEGPIQSLSTVHGAEYADYSHGIRFVSNIVEVDHEVLDLRNVVSHKLSAAVAVKPVKIRAADNARIKPIHGNVHLGISSHDINVTDLPHAKLISVMAPYFWHSQILKRFSALEVNDSLAAPLTVSHIRETVWIVRTHTKRRYETLEHESSSRTA